MPTNSPNSVQPKDIFRHPVHFLSFGFGSGLSPKAPGTMGSLAAVPLILAMLYWLTPTQFLVLTIIAFLIGIYLCDRTAKALGVHDHGGIVWDEIVGMMIACWSLPQFGSLAAGLNLSLGLLLAFVLFRFFDILKPYPISALDKKVHGGLGIMVDDVLAGIYALILLQVLGWLV